MNWFKLFFLVFTIVEVLLTGLYYLLRGALDMVIIMGLIIYAIAMLFGFIACAVHYLNEQKKEMLESLP